VDSGLDVVIETGTYLGDFIAYIRDCAKEVYSVEISTSLYQDAKRRFHNERKVHLVQGDSQIILPTIVEGQSRRCFFWLDAHYSSGITAGLEEPPILKELEAILNSSYRRRLNHLIVIDDAREFTGANNYPTIEQIRNLVDRTSPTWVVEVRDDMIVVRHP
jgi:hypothetical protein